VYKRWVEIPPTGRDNFGGCTANSKALGVPDAEYAASR